MSENPSNLNLYNAYINGDSISVRNFDEGVEKMFAAPNHIFITESSMIPYFIKTYGCQFIIIDDESFPFYYGVSFYKTLPKWLKMENMREPLTGIMNLRISPQVVKFQACYVNYRELWNIIW